MDEGEDTTTKGRGVILEVERGLGERRLIDLRADRYWWV